MDDVSTPEQIAKVREMRVKAQARLDVVVPFIATYGDRNDALNVRQKIEIFLARCDITEAELVARLPKNPE